MHHQMPFSGSFVDLNVPPRSDQSNSFVLNDLNRMAQHWTWLGHLAQVSISLELKLKLNVGTGFKKGHLFKVIHLDLISIGTINKSSILAILNKAKILLYKLMIFFPLILPREVLQSSPQLTLKRYELQINREQDLIWTQLM